MDAPAQVAGYSLLRELGRGGMGVVYEARCPELERRVALKLLHVGASDEDVARLRLEARAMARACHPHVVTIHRVGQSEGRWYLVLDLVEGPSLKQRVLEHGPLGAQDAARLTEKLAAALAHTHAQGILHRDVKPSNVLLDSSGEPRLTDYGLARDSRRESDYTVTGMVLGSPAYMPPEQALGMPGEVDDRSDVYGLGATLYEMLCGKPPFSGPLMGVLQAVIMDDPPAPGQVHAGVDPILEGICLRAMAKEPAARYPTMQAFAEHLRAYLDGALALPLTSRTRSGRVARFDPVRTGSFVWSVPQPRRRRSRLSRLALVGSVGCVVAASLALPLAVLLAPADEPARRLSRAAPTPPAAAADTPAAALRSPSAGTSYAEADADAPEAESKPEFELTPPRLIPTEGEPRQRPGSEPDLEPAPERTPWPDLGAAEPSESSGEPLAATASSPPLEDAAGLPAVVTLRDALALGSPTQDAPASSDAEEADDAEGAEAVAPADWADAPLGDRPNPIGEPLPLAPPPTSELNRVTEALLVYAAMQRAAEASQPYEQLVAVERDPEGYRSLDYYQNATARAPNLLEDYGQAVLVGNSTRVDWIVEGTIYPEVLLSAPATSAATYKGLAFVATTDPQVAGSGDVYRRDLQGRWQVSLDGHGEGAVVGSFRGDVYAAVGGAPGVAAELFRFDDVRQVWDLAGTLGDCLPTHLLEFQRELWVVGTPRADGDGIHVYHGADGFFAREAKPIGGKRPEAGERERATATLTQSGNLFLATVKEVAGAVVEGQLLVFETGRQGETKFKRLAKHLRGEAPLCLAYQDRTLYLGTDQGRLLYLDRKLDKNGQPARKFGAQFHEDPSIRFNQGIHSLLAQGQGNLLVGIEGNVGAEILLRRPKGPRIAQGGGQGSNPGPG